MSNKKISASTVRYVKLGVGGKFEQTALRDRRLYIGYHDAPHERCISGDWDSISRIYRDHGHSPPVASNHSRQVRDFYEAPDSCLWITFFDGAMWWTFAKPEVIMCIEENWQDIESNARAPSRFRSCVDRWRNTNIHGDTLLMRKLPGYVTKVVSGFRGTICNIADANAVVRIINGEVDPSVQKAIAARDELISCVERVVNRLYWKDFETLKRFQFI